jgi:AAA+ ATPase superfamily predicted ATPase
MKFVNRKNELKFLQKKWTELKSQFIIVYGKRRVGKTELIKQFIGKKNGIYFLADKRSETEQLKEFGRIVGEHYNDDILIKNGFEDWLQAFAYLKKNIKSKLVIAIDEYPYLVESNKAISSIFQKGWDECLKDINVFLILSGSSIAMMESEALIYKAPLYGRRTGQILLQPMKFKETRQFYPKLNFEKSLDFYTVSGGIPAYILQLNPKISLKQNIQEKIFTKTEFLHNEIEFVLKEELREPKNYLSILKAISFGKRKFGEIANDIGLEKNVLTKYLNTLERLQIIKKEVPITEKTPEKSRKGLYLIIDNFFRFWFQYIYAYKSDLEIENYTEVNRKIKESFINLSANSYEQVAVELMWEFRDMFFRFERVGKWWEKNEEIDLVGINQETKEIVFGEVKWTKKPIGTNIYLDLKEKSKKVDWNQGTRKEFFVLFSRGGFTKDMIRLAKEEKVVLVWKDKVVLPKQ